MKLKFPKNFKVTEGTVVAIPVKPGGWVLGVYARVKRGRGAGVPFGYFFGTVHHVLPDETVIADLRPRDAILQCVFGDLGLIEGRWPIVGLIKPWNRHEWPMPDMMVSGAELGIPYDQLMRFDEDDPSKLVELTYFPVGTLQLPSAAMPGSTALEITLSMILSGEKPIRNTLRNVPLQ